MKTATRGPLIDGHGRRITYARISVTDRCNLQCVYCKPDGRRLRPVSSLMTRSEIARASRLLSEFGIEKVRITGGEPTARADIVEIVEDLASIRFPGGIALYLSLFKFIHAKYLVGLRQMLNLLLAEEMNDEAPDFIHVLTAADSRSIVGVSALSRASTWPAPSGR